MKPHARDYILPMMGILFGLNFLFSFAHANIKSEIIMTIALIAIILVETAVASWLMMKYDKDSNKYNRENKK